MSASLQQLSDGNPALAVPLLIVGFLGYTLLVFVPLCAICYLIYFLLTLPMRRAERARYFLDLLEFGINQGQSPEAALIAASRSRDRAPGVRFHLLAAYLEKGVNFSQALAAVPRLLPPEIQNILMFAQPAVDLRKLIAPSRRILNDSVSQVRGALNYVILVTLAITPLSAVIPFILRIKVMPAFQQVFATLLETQPLPVLTRLVFAGGGWFFDLQLLLFGLLWGCLLAYVAGPRLRGWLETRMPGLISGLLFKLPWRRKRMERDFSMVLALLLDAGVPEADAVKRAGQSTDNTLMLARAERVVARLSTGIKLPDAIREMEDSDEAAWRLTNALRRGTGFMAALNGWHEALSARAFQLEQSAAQLFTTGLVLFNGLIVGCVVIGLFEALIQIMQGAILW